jgi:hypothetical protein
MTKKRLIILAVLVVVAFIAWKFGGTLTQSISGLLGSSTMGTPVPGTKQPATGSQALAQPAVASNLSTLFPPDVFGPYSLGTLDS